MVETVSGVLPLDPTGSTNESKDKTVFPGLEKKDVEKILNYRLWISKISQKVANLQDCEDILATAYEKFILAMTKKEIEKPANYFERIIDNLIIDYYRSQKSTPLPLDDPDLLARRTTFDNDIIISEDRDAFMRAWKSLLAVERRVLTLRAQGLSIPAIATDIKRTDDATKQLVYRARQNLNKRLVVEGLKANDS